MGWKNNVDKSKFLSADERILLALYLVNQEKSISWLTGWLAPDYNGKNVYATLSRLAKRQLIDRVREGSDPATWTPAFAEASAGKEGSDPLYRITQLGIAWLERRFPLAVKERPDLKGSDLGHGERSDPSLKAVIIDAAEVKGRRRKLLFDELKRWRYGRLSRGVYLTGSAKAQAALAGFVDRYRLTGYVNLMAIAPAQDPKILADRVFGLTDRNAAWRLLIDRMNEWQRIGDSPVRLGGTITGLRRIRQDFLQLLVTEPGLPPELLPENYFMNKAIEIILINIGDRR